MSDLMSRLAALHDGPAAALDDAVVAADLRRGHDALVTRRRRRTRVAGVATLGVVAVSSLSYALVGGNSTTTRLPASSAAVTVRLTAYRGGQLPGYTVAQVPAGYVLQGVSDSVLDIAESGDHSPLDTFVGKLVVMLNDHPGPDTGTPVSVNGHPGRVSDDGGVLALTYSDGTHDVEVQSWSNISISVDQLVQFAEGITVLPSAQEGHG